MEMRRSYSVKCSFLGILLAGVLVATVGCASFNPWDLVYPPVSSEEILPGPPTDGKGVKARFVSVLEDAAALLGGTWRPNAVGTPSECGPDLSKNEGFHYVADWDRVEIADDPDAVTKTLMKHWKEQGYKVEAGTWKNGTQTVNITTKSGDDYWFHNYEGELSLGAASSCYPGDWHKIEFEETQENIRRRATETPVPTAEPDSAPTDVG